MAAAEATVTEVLAILPEHAMAHLIMGLVLIYTNRVTQDIGETQLSLALARNLAAAHAVLGIGKTFSGCGEETEAHIQEALHLSPRDINAYVWMTIAAAAKLHLGADEEAARWSRRAVEANRNNPIAYFWLAVALAQLARLEEARGAAVSGLALNPTFTVSAFRAGVRSDHPIFLAQRERVYVGMRKAGVPEG
jgi:tetratricopeptide (TPR) repeat protein